MDLALWLWRCAANGIASDNSDVQPMAMHGLLAMTKQMVIPN
jgi:hypothetical protein